MRTDLSSPKARGVLFPLHHIARRETCWTKELHYVTQFIHSTYPWNCSWAWCWPQTDWRGTPGSTHQPHPGDVNKDGKSQDMHPFHCRTSHQATLKNCHCTENWTKKIHRGRVTWHLKWTRGQLSSPSNNICSSNPLWEKPCIKSHFLNKQPSNRILSY